MRGTVFLGVLGALLALTPAEAQSGRLRERWRKRIKERNTAKAKKRQNVHGGKLATANGYTFEVVLAEKTIRIYVLREGKPFTTKKLRGKVAIGIVRRNLGRRGNHQTSSAKLSAVGTSKKRGRLRSYLQGKHKLGKADRQGMRLDVTITNLPKTKTKTEFRVSFTGLSPTVRYRCPSACKKVPAFLDPGKCPKCSGKLKPKITGLREGWKKHPTRKR